MTTLNPDIDFQCKNGSIIQLQHHKYPWSGRKAETLVLFGDDVMCRKDFYDYIYNQIPPVLPYLFNGYAYSLKTLVLPWIWEKFSRGNCVMAGFCFRHMVVKGYLPFTPRHMPCDSSGTRHYFYTGPNSDTFDFSTNQLTPKQGGRDAS